MFSLLMFDKKAYLRFVDEVTDLKEKEKKVTQFILISPVKLLYVISFICKLSVYEYELEQPRLFLDSDIPTDILNFILLLSFGTLEQDVLAGSNKNHTYNYLDVLQASFLSFCFCFSVLPVAYLRFHVHLFVLPFSYLRFYVLHL